MSPDRAHQTVGLEVGLLPGVELLVDPTYCSAVAFVGTPMQRKLVGGDFVGPGEVVIRSAVVVDSGGERCDVVTDVATAAAKLYT